jgi:hypothetical protein
MKTTTTYSNRPLFIRPRQVPEFFGISERQVRFLMMRCEPLAAWFRDD